MDKRTPRQDEICPKCLRVVEASDPRRVPVGRDVFHGRCFNSFSPWEQEKLLDAAERK
jgi:hypothetical protein